MIPIHSMAAGLGFAAALAHIYLAVVQNPDSLRCAKGAVIKKEIDAACKA